MNQKDAEILGKIMEIARLKKEIVQAIVPEKTYKHLEVIGSEFKAMMVDLISEVASDCDCKRKADERNGCECKTAEDKAAYCCTDVKTFESERTSKVTNKQTSKIKKVDID